MKKSLMKFNEMRNLHAWREKYKSLMKFNEI